MTEETFLRKKKFFEGALYKGVFSKTYGQELWWKSSLYDLVFKRAKKILPKEIKTDVREVSSKLFKLKEREIAKCVVCGGLFPDTLGRELENEAKVAVHYRCSESDPKSTRTLYFDEIRIIDSEKGK
jgi:calcineurin-like phosphoesterase